MNTPLCRRNVGLAEECVDREVQAAPEARLVLRRAHLVVTMPLMDHHLTHLLPAAPVDPAALADREVLVGLVAPEALARLPSP